MSGVLTQSRLREILDYNQQTGAFHWREKVSRKVVVGKEAGTKEEHTGRMYRRIAFYGQSYYGHRLAWLHVYGVWPVYLIDHIDGDGLNNSILNLRAATNAQNSRNMRRSVKNTSGFKGVHKFKRDGRYMAQIGVDGRSVFLGYFDTPEEGARAYADAARKYHGDFARSETLIDGA